MTRVAAIDVGTNAMRCLLVEVGEDHEPRVLENVRTPVRLGSHVFLTHEFVDALVNERRPAVDIYEALAMTVPGIIAHESALRDGETMKIPSFDPAS